MCVLKNVQSNCWKKSEHQFAVISFTESPVPSRLHLFLLTNTMMSHVLLYEMNLKEQTTVTCLLLDFKRGLRDVYLKTMFFQSLLHINIVALFPLRHIDQWFLICLVETLHFDTNRPNGFLSIGKLVTPGHLILVLNCKSQHIHKLIFPFKVSVF